MTERAPAGWYPDAEGQPRYWDGVAWAAPPPGPNTDRATTTTTTTTTTTGLSVAAVITAVVVPPVGLILGIVAAVSNRKRVGRAGGLPIASIIIGSILTIGAVVVTVTAVIVGGAITAQKKAEYCEIVAAYPGELDAMWRYGTDQSPGVTAQVLADDVALRLVPVARSLAATAWDEDSRYDAQYFADIIGEFAETGDESAIAAAGQSAGSILFNCEMLEDAG